VGAVLAVAQLRLVRVEAGLPAVEDEVAAHPALALC
jgi:hypothetical protein